jgi:two-component system, OmpR family, phosphate regulon sensor histidine kinase PhoR
MKKQIGILYYILSGYVVLQFVWWGYLLLKLTNQLLVNDPSASKRVLMIIGEGSIFFALLILGLWKIRSSVKKELSFSQRQSNFLLSVTHELKTPLASNKLYLQTIKKHKLEEEKRNELLDKALLENRRLESMVDNILTASRLENKSYNLMPEPVDVTLLLQSIQQKWNGILGLEIISIVGNLKNSIQIDRWVLESCVTNLIENAIKYANGAKIILEIIEEQRQFKIKVVDEGLGIAKNKQHLIFEKFVRLENEETRSQKGTGLGLYIVAQFTQLLKGKIEYFTNSPHGSIFQLTLPL